MTRLGRKGKQLARAVALAVATVLWLDSAILASYALTGLRPMLMASFFVHYDLPESVVALAGLSGPYRRDRLFSTTTSTNMLADAKGLRSGLSSGARAGPRAAVGLSAALTVLLFRLGNWRQSNQWAIAPIAMLLLEQLFWLGSIHDCAFLSSAACLFLGPLTLGLVGFWLPTTGPQ